MIKSEYKKYLKILFEPGKENKASFLFHIFSEEGISRVFENLAKGKTMITIAHRLQTVMSSDTIVLFDGGKIIDSGNLRSCGRSLVFIRVWLICRVGK